MQGRLERPGDLAMQTIKMILSSIRWRDSYVMDVKPMEDKKLSHKKILILMIIYTGQAKTVSDLEHIFSSSSSSLSILVSKLTDEGYLRKELPGCGEDGRRIYFKLTDKGYEIIQYAFLQISDNINTFYDSLNQARQEYYITAISCLNKVFEMDEEEKQ